MRQKIFLSFVFAILLIGCKSNGDVYPETDFISFDGEIADGGDSYTGGSSYAGGGQDDGDNTFAPGLITASEWSDLNNWLFWSNLISSKDQEGIDYGKYCSDWSFFTNNRVAVNVVDAVNNPVCDAEVSLANVNGTTLWSSRTDKNGNTNLWLGVNQSTQYVDSSLLVLHLNDIKQDIPVSITHLNDAPKINQLVYQSHAPQVNALDVAFIVDATGSMSDEIDFLKADLLDILKEVKSYNSQTTLSTASVFYRDEGDEYVTRTSDFTTNISSTIDFIGRQYADGGGDYPEAVHTALEVGLQKLNWNEGNSMRIAFLILDAPPHQNDNVIANLHESIEIYAKKGIRIIPIAASGIDKSTEIFLRCTCIVTNGTYVFITNDSGIGNDHIEASVGEHVVEPLRDIMVRIITENM